MRLWIACLLMGCLSAGLAGCATTGRTYDDAKIAHIEKGSTTERQLVEWFGAPNARVLSPDGRKNLSWRFARKSAHTTTPGRLEVNLAPDGTVVGYSAASGAK